MPIDHPSRGFTLTELAVVLIVLALLTGGLMLSLTTQRAIQQRNDSEKQLADIREAILGFAAANGRLPCPATAASNGLEFFCNSASDCSAPTTTVPTTHGRCQQFFNGFVPGTTLGLAALDDQGRVVDAWNNPIRYSVSDKSAGSPTVDYVFTKKDGIKEAKLENVAGLDLLFICRAYPGSMSPTDCGMSANKLTSAPPFVLLSTGQSGAASTNNDALSNRNNDAVFVNHTPTPAVGTDTGFDDIVVWLSPGVLYNRLIAAGRLP